MTMREVRCPSCGAPMAAQAFTGAHFTCRFCGAGIVVAPAVATAAAITIDRVGQPMIEVIKQVRRFSGLGLAEVQHALTRLPATFSVREASPADAMTALSALGCVGRIVTEAVHLPADPAFVAHDGAWGSGSRCRATRRSRRSSSFARCPGSGSPRRRPRSRRRER